jgi:uncharacterized protein (TIGR04255 family)
MIMGPSAGRPAMGFQIDVSTGQATPLTGSGPSIFATTDRATQFIIAPNSLTARTTSYVRWSPFIGQVEEMMLPLINVYSDAVSVKTVQLDYVDRFLWTGDWSNFDWKALLRSDGKFVAAEASKAHQLWHTHSGWLEDLTSGGHRLVNVNIDLGDFARPEGGAVPTIGILTLMRDDIVPEKSDVASIQGHLEEIHNQLKTLFGHIITEQMAERISLNDQVADATRH